MTEDAGRLLRDKLEQLGIKFYVADTLGMYQSKHGHYVRVDELGALLLQIEQQQQEPPEWAALVAAVDAYRAQEHPTFPDDISFGFRLGTVACYYVDAKRALGQPRAEQEPT